jgi:hypothetical protein
MLPVGPTEQRVMAMPLWPDCPWTLPADVEARSDKTVAVLRSTNTGKFVGLRLNGFDSSKLPELLSRLE